MHSQKAYDALFARSNDRQLQQPIRHLAEMYRSLRRRMEATESTLDKKYPQLLAALDEEQQEHRGQWPEWCWLPLTRVYKVAERILPSAPAHVQASAAQAATAYGAWRGAGRPVVYFHEGHFERWQQRVDVLPRDLPDRWPVPGAFYVSAGSTRGGSFLGVYIYLEWDEAQDRAELRFLLDLADRPRPAEMIPQPLHLVGKSVHEAMAATMTNFVINADLVTGGPEQVPVTGVGTEFDRRTPHMAEKIGLYVAIADQIADAGTSFTDAAAIYRDAMAGKNAGFTGPKDLAQWPTTAGPQAPMLLWLA